MSGDSLVLKNVGDLSGGQILASVSLVILVYDDLNCSTIRYSIYMHIHIQKMGIKWIFIAIQNYFKRIASFNIFLYYEHYCKVVFL